ncbi:hypothetical protein B0O99DRAFT_691724 [Bisporella sp. PMI_857]|nr:hypothetical protein B0O99DRAFT_691724 [Bisporella sp. PMI_857]
MSQHPLPNQSAPPVQVPKNQQHKPKFKDWQREYLENIFHGGNMYPRGLEKQHMAAHLGVPFNQVMTWFYEKRRRTLGLNSERRRESMLSEGPAVDPTQAIKQESATNGVLSPFTNADQKFAVSTPAVVYSTFTEGLATYGSASVQNVTVSTHEQTSAAASFPEGCIPFGSPAFHNRPVVAPISAVHSTKVPEESTNYGSASSNVQKLSMSNFLEGNAPGSAVAAEYTSPTNEFVTGGQRVPITTPSGEFATRPLFRANQHIPMAIPPQAYGRTYKPIASNKNMQSRMLFASSVTKSTQGYAAFEPATSFASINSGYSAFQQAQSIANASPFANVYPDFVTFQKAKSAFNAAQSHTACGTAHPIDPFQRGVNIDPRLYMCGGYPNIDRNGWVRDGNGNLVFIGEPYL